MVDHQREQVGAAACSDSGSTLCDIIAQQREFQLRQELRNLGHHSPLLNSANLQQQQQQQQQNISTRNTCAKMQRKQQSIGGYNSTADFEHLVALNNGSSAIKQQHQAANNSHDQQPGQKHHAKRKFSLSYAMSNLAPFGNSSSSSSQAPLNKGASGQKRGSLAFGCSTDAGGLNGEDDFALAACGDELRNERVAARSLGPKKKSFMHKAIRRGSKLFDSMLLSSAQQQAAQEAALQQQEESQSSSCGSDTNQQQVAAVADAVAGELNADCPQATSGRCQTSGARVQFASMEQQQQELEREPSKPPRTRRRLRLGSIPHDLRRVLSLTGNSVSAAASSSSDVANLGPVCGSTTNGNGKVKSKLASASSTVGCRFDSSSAQFAAGGGLSQFLVGNDQTTVSRESSKLAAGQVQVQVQVSNNNNANKDPARLKRKNSLFAPLTSAASSAFYHHAHAHHHQQHKPPTSSPNTEVAQKFHNQQAAPAAGAAASAGQSASFSLCQDHSQTYKLIIFGSSAVGKTSIIQRFLYGHFPVAHKPTVEELHSNKYNIPDLGEIYLEILDTSGTFEFPAMRRLSIEKGDAFILVYSVADAASWQEVIHLRQLILEEKGDDLNNQQPVAPARNQRGNKGSNAPIPTAATTKQNTTEQEPISSIYAAATRLATAQRRTSSSPMLESNQVPTSASSPNTRPISHYNSQLSRLLQQTPSAGNSKGSLLQSLSIADGDEAGDDDDNDDGGDEELTRASSAAATTQQRPHSTTAPTTTTVQQQKQVQVQVPVQSRKRRTPIVVVANKCDLDTESFQVQQEEAERLVTKQWGNSFVNCSAKEALNIDKVFKELLRQARAPDILSQFVIDDHQQRRQSLPVLKNQLSAHHLKGLRNLYNQQQLVSTAGNVGQTGKQVATMQRANDLQESRPISSASDDSQCRVM